MVILVNARPSKSEATLEEPAGPSDTAPAPVSRRRFIGTAAVGAVSLAAAACGGGGGENAADSEEPPPELARTGEELETVDRPTGPVLLAFGARTEGESTALTRALAGYDNPDVDIEVADNPVEAIDLNDPDTIAASGADLVRWGDGYGLGTLVDEGVIRPDLAGAGPLLPVARHAWGVFYRKSVFRNLGLDVPTGLNELFTVCEKAQNSGLTPFATANAEGWEAVGWFDTLGLRLNGSDYHWAMATGKVDFTEDNVAQIFVLWQQLAPFMEPNSASRTWQDAAKELHDGNAAMLLTGSFVASEFPPADLDDLDFFAFPALTDNGAGDLIVPIDGLVMPVDAPNPEAATELAQYLGAPAAQQAFASGTAGSVAVDTSQLHAGANSIQAKVAEAISGATTQNTTFLRATSPAFTSVVTSAIASFVDDSTTYANQIDELEEGRSRNF